MKNNQYIPKDIALKNVIQSIWQVDNAPLFNKEQILPKGVVEIIFNFSDSASIPAQFGSKQFYLSKTFINGFNSMPVQIQLPHKQVFFGITFQPLAIKKILGVPASEFSDSSVDVSLLHPGFHSLWHQLGEQIDFEKRVGVFIEWLSKKSVEWQPQEKMLNHFLYSLYQQDTTVKGLANTLCYSPRQLSRKIIESTGMNTEEILLYKKYLRSMDLIHQTEMSLTEIAYESNFTDQSHFIKTFKSFSSLTPGEYKRNRSFIKGHLFENVR